jgi:hypothetical protein
VSVGVMEADWLERVLFCGYDSNFDGDEPPGFRRVAPDRAALFPKRHPTTAFRILLHLPTVKLFHFSQKPAKNAEAVGIVVSATVNRPAAILPGLRDGSSIRAARAGA